MSHKWTGSHSESGILRKSEFKEKKEDLFVFGYSCKLFRDDDKAIHIDQGKHLIPWMGDETLKIDRYDARGALHDLSRLEAPPGGYDWRVELTRGEQDVEQLCDEERYRALHTDEDEEEMYKEEELKRLHKAGYGQVGFNYDTPAEPSVPVQPQEVDEPFVPTPSFRSLLPIDIEFPESLKQNAIIEKTANFIASQGTQMEILIKAKQGDNPQFQFLNRDSSLNPYYVALIALVKAGKWPEKKVVEEKPPENEEYLHPSLASTVIESAPAIPSIHYKPSADCDYTMLISKFRGTEGDGEPQGDVPPPGTEPPPRAQIYRAPVMYTRGADGNHVDPTAQPPPAPAPPVQPRPQYAAYYHQYLAQEKEKQKKEAAAGPVKSTGLSLMKNYNTDTDSDMSDSDESVTTESKDKPTIVTPPEDIQIVIDKMAGYVARNGDAFADIVRARNDPRFTFLEPDNVHHAYYKRLMQQKRLGDVNGKEKKKRTAAPVSFSIKKLKEPDPILPKPALPYESSSDEESENKQTEKQEEFREPPKIAPSIVNHIPPVIMYKLDGQNSVSVSKPVEPTKPVNIIQEYKETPKPIENIPKQKPTKIETEEFIEQPKEHNNVIKEKTLITQSPPKPEIEDLYKKDVENSLKIDKIEKEIPLKRDKESPLKKENAQKRDNESPYKQDKDSPRRREKESPYVRDRDSPYRKDKNKHSDNKKEYRSKSEAKEDRKSQRRSAEREKRKEKVKVAKYSKDDLENEIISLEDYSDEMIDLTGDQSDSKECDTEAERAKQNERRRRAAEFLLKVGVDPAAAALPTTSLASAMVDTLESLRKKKAEEEEKRRRRDKKRHRERRDEEDSERGHRKSKRRRNRSSDGNESDYDSSKKKKRKKDRKHSSKTKKKRRREELDEEDPPLPPNIDLTNTLKVLRSASPTKELGLDIEPISLPRRYSSEEEELVRDRRKNREDREYSEGEWSSDSEDDSKSSASRND